MTRFVLDSNIVSWLTIRVPALVTRMNQRVTGDDAVLGCPMVWYEVRRGLLARDARRKMQHFENLFAQFEWQDYTRDDWALAARLWTQRRSQGKPIADNDLLIAVFAINRNAILVTDNSKDFSTLDVQTENWR
jgi:tRNA(fMet)-specific endonuclease VapC